MTDRKSIEDFNKMAIEHIDVKEELGEKDTRIRDYAGAAAKTDPAEIRLVRKLDMRILPTLFVMYFLNYVDRNAIAQARLNGLEDELGMNAKSTQFNTAVSILFVGYILGQVPSQMIITKLRPSLYMSGWMVVWAIVSGCTALVKSYNGLVVCRFLLGVTEAPFYPGATYVLSIFYTRKEIASRIAYLYLAQITATGFSSLIAAGIFEGLDGKHGISGWRWLFMIEGIATFGVAVLGFWLLPDTPKTTRWLSEAEREIAHSRMVRDNITMSDDDVPAMEGLKQACKDYKTWIFVLMQCFHLSACSFNSFFPTVVKTLGFSTTITLVMTCPPFLLAGAGGLFMGWSSGRFHERTWHITAGLSVAIIGFAVAAASRSTAGRYVGCFIFPLGAYSVNSVIIGWVASTLAQTKEKKAVVLAMTNVGGQIGYIYGAYLWPGTDTPRYITGFSASAAFAAGSIAAAWWMRVVLRRENQKIMSAGNENVNLYGY